AMLLTRQQAEYVGRLAVGQAIVKLQGRILEPFLVQLTQTPLQKGKATDNDVQDQFATFVAQNRRISPHVAKRTPIPPARHANEEARPSYVELDQASLRLLRDIVEHATSGVAERYKRLGLRPERGTHLKNNLITSGLVREERITRGRATSVLLGVTPR